MSLFLRFFKFIQSEAHALLNRFMDPVKLIEQGIRDLKKDFDESMKNVAQVKAISICSKRELEAKKQIAKDYEQKALIILQKAKNGELDEKEADRLATAALEKKQEALSRIQKLSQDIQQYDTSLVEMEKKILDLKNKIKDSENEYMSLKARASVAKTTKKINKQLAGVNSDSTVALIEEMKQKIQEEEGLAQAYGELGDNLTSIDDEINNAIGVSADTQQALAEMKQKLLQNPDSKTEDDEVEKLKKELEE